MTLEVEFPFGFEITKVALVMAGVVEVEQCVVGGQSRLLTSGE